MRRPAIVAALAVLSGLLLRRTKAKRAERDLWTEATSAPDLR